ncbi:multidrug efflux SMR transporter [Geobacillus thermoleovorans]|uniref:DMT family transporter n=1 Tax=Geobacillus thermoleovorans TaxID=33941 RepID=UPI00345B7330
MAWIFLAIAITFEILGTVSLKLSNGFNSIWATVLVIMSYTICFASLGIALKGIDVSVAYAIWSGLGITFISLIGMAFFNEEFNIVKCVGIFMIIMGVLLLKIF